MANNKLMKAIMKRFLLLLTLMVVALMLTTQDAWAQKKPWVKMDNNVLTFSYGVKPKGGDVNEVPLNVKHMLDIPWFLFAERIQRVVFTPSFKQVKNLKSTDSWFLNMENVTSITGLENLVTDNVTNMDHMFCNCKKITSLDLTNFNTDKVTNMNKMFAGCEKLTSLDLRSFNIVNVDDMEGMFLCCYNLKKILVYEGTWNNNHAIRDNMFTECAGGLVWKKMPLNKSYKAPPARVTASGANLLITVGSASYTMVRVEGGSFTMGGTSEQGKSVEKDETPVHQVTLSSFYMGETEVTQALWQAVMGSNPSKYKGNNKPVENVSWDDCLEFIQKLNQLTGRNFRLPTEAEWEFAARGGNKGHGYKFSGSNNVEDVAWLDTNSKNTTHDVKTKPANELGLYDMSGNVHELCQDWHGSYSSSAQTNPTGKSFGEIKVARGGNYYRSARECRVSFRNTVYPHMYYDEQGLRLVLP